MENIPKLSIYYRFCHIIFCSALKKVLLLLIFFWRKNFQ
jgi:hypothetical protein